MNLHPTTWGVSIPSYDLTTVLKTCSSSRYFNLQSTYNTKYSVNVTQVVVLLYYLGSKNKRKKFIRGQYRYNVLKFCFIVG